MKSKILEMSLNFLESSVDYIKGDQSKLTELQFSTIHLVAAIELMLKARLVEEHWSLIIKDTNQLNQTKFKSGDFKSLNIDEAISRIVNVCGIKISDKNRKRIDRLKKERNKIIHIGSSVNQYQASSFIVDAYSFLYDFAIEARLFSQGSDLEIIFSEIKTKINNIEDFVTNRLNHIRNILVKHNNVINCPECWQKSVVFSEKSRDCLFCRKEFEIDDFVGLYCDTFFSFDFIGDIVSECPECGENSAIFAEEIGSVICLSCGSTIIGYLQCMDCGEFFYGDSNYPICPVCVRNRFDNDQMMPAPEFPED